MRAIVTIPALACALALSGCGQGANTTDEQNLALENLTGENFMVDDENSLNAAGNGSVDEQNTQNMMVNDATTNDPDTNLANGI